MRKIDVSTWKRFKISDLGFTNFHGKRLNKANRIEGNIPFLTAGKENNGLTMFIGNKRPVYHNPITVDMFGNCFYQPFDCAGDDNVYFFVNDALSANCKMFIASVINAETKVLYAYIDQFRQSQANDLTAVLPVDKSGNPDWTYMDSYMSQVIQDEKKNLDTMELADSGTKIVDVSDWDKFIIGDLFEKLTLKTLKPDFNKNLDVSETRSEEFNLPLVNAKHGNNGIMFYGREEDFEFAEMTIDIVQNGAIATGDVYAQPQKTGVLWDAYLIKPKIEITSPLTLQFLATVIEKAIKDRFSYDDKCVWNKAKLLSITLPIDASGSPDWEYMDSYMTKIFSQANDDIKKLSSII